MFVMASSPAFEPVSFDITTNTSNATTSCPSCGLYVRQLGKHITGCKERDFSAHRANVTKATKSRRRRCHKCQRVFVRLDTHLRTSVACRDSTLLEKPSTRRSPCVRACQQLLLQTADRPSLSRPHTPLDSTQLENGPTSSSQPTSSVGKTHSTKASTFLPIEVDQVSTLGDGNLHEGWAARNRQLVTSEIPVMAKSLHSGSTCPFCNSIFKKLGNHLPHCHQRNSRDYSSYLSKITINKKLKLCKKKLCPHCGKLFSRLDTHLRNSVHCKSFCLSTIELTTTHEHTGNVSEHVVEDSIQPSLCTSPAEISKHQAQANSCRREHFKCPKSSDEWLEADEQLAESVVPAVLAAVSPEEKNKVLCDGIYSFFSSKYGTRSVKKYKRRKAKRDGKILIKIREERNKVRRELRMAKNKEVEP